MKSRIHLCNIHDSPECDNVHLHNLLQLIMHCHVAPCDSHIQFLDFNVDELKESRQIVEWADEEHIDGGECERSIWIHDEDEHESIKTEKPGLFPIETETVEYERSEDIKCKKKKLNNVKILTQPWRRCTSHRVP